LLSRVMGLANFRVLSSIIFVLVMLMLRPFSFIFVAKSLALLYMF
jgi:hypothetical protein